MSKCKRVDEISISVVPDFRPLTEEQKKEFATSSKVESERLLKDCATKVVLSISDPITSQAFQPPQQTILHRSLRHH